MNFELIRGDDQIISLEITQDGVAVDITDWTIYFTLKRNIEDDDDDAVIAKDITVHTEPLVGKTEIPLLNTETDSLEGLYHYDIQFKDDSTPAIIKTVIQGMINFKQDVTRRID